MYGGWWPCPSCDTPVPFAYQIEESFDGDGKATFDPAGSLTPRPDDDSLSACWLRIVRCPGDGCDNAWALMLYPTSKSLFDEEAASYPA